jgi:hypothetical protein
MVNPDLVANGDHDIFISGNDVEAKTAVTKILRDWFGWKSIVDLGDISNARDRNAAADLGATLREIPKSQLQFQNCSIK